MYKNAKTARVRYKCATGGRVEDLELLEHSTIPRAPGTSILGLFGVDRVDGALAVMIGCGDQLATEMRKWPALVICAAVLVGTGIALAVTGSGATSEYATIGSFFLSVPVTVASIISIAEARSKASPITVTKRSPARSPQAIPPSISLTPES